MFKLYKKIFLVIIGIQSLTIAQSFGFGCLGLVGGFGGYSYLQYQPDGLNRYVDNFNNDPVISQYNENEMSHFGKAAGYRVGVNFFRAKFTGFFVSAKGYYEQLHEEHSAKVYQTAIGVDYEYDLKLKNIGIGLDLGIPVTKFLSWKIVDGSILLNSTRFTETINSTQGTLVTKYESDKTDIGYSIGTGIIIDIIKNYISIEGVASYTQFSVDKMKLENGSDYLNYNTQTGSADKFIARGGFNAVVQLNLSFPL